jgi:serine/threonine protein kinase
MKLRFSWPKVTYLLACVLSFAGAFSVPGVCLSLFLYAGLEYLHREDVIHGDFKPGNILLLKDGSKIVAKINDFGAAHALHALLHLMNRRQARGWLGLQTHARAPFIYAHFEAGIC